MVPFRPTELSENTRIALVGLFALTAVVLIELRPWASPAAVDAVAPRSEQPLVEPRLLIQPALEAQFREDTTASIKALNPELEQMMADEDFGALTDRLLNLASETVASGAEDHLLQILSLLGQVAIEQGQLDSAEVYLFEALDLLGERANGPEGADIYLQLGRTYLRSRENARSAGYAYDALQIGRNQLRRGRIDLAEQNIRLAIDHSLSINRYNGAASGYLSLSELHRQRGDNFQAEEALLEAARLFSASGQEVATANVLEQLATSGIEGWRLDAVRFEIADNLAGYERDIRQIGNARDYQRLYNYYLSENNRTRAWHFRLLASESLKSVSRRTLFHRQQGVLALLYNSNDAMANAKRYFAEASDRFTEMGDTNQEQRTGILVKEVY